MVKLTGKAKAKFLARMKKGRKAAKGKKKSGGAKKNNSKRKTLERRIAHLEKLIESNKYGFDSFAKHDEGEKFDLKMAKKQLSDEMKKELDAGRNG